MPTPSTAHVERPGRVRDLGRGEGSGVPTPAAHGRIDDQSADAKCVVNRGELHLADGLAVSYVEHPRGRAGSFVQIVEVARKEGSRHPWAGEGKESLGVGNPARGERQVCVRPWA